jgi:hypothetical protein
MSIALHRLHTGRGTGTGVRHRDRHRPGPGPGPGPGPVRPSHPLLAARATAPALSRSRRKSLRQCAVSPVSARPEALSGCEDTQTQASAAAHSGGTAHRARCSRHTAKAPGLGRRGQSHRAHARRIHRHMSHSVALRPNHNRRRRSHQTRRLPRRRRHLHPRPRHTLRC